MKFALPILLLTALLAALVYSGKVSQPAWASTPFVSGTGYIDNHLAGFRKHVNRVRDQKCLAPVRPSSSATDLAAMSTVQRRTVRVAWKQRHWRAHGAGSGCAPAIDHRWLWECVHAHEGAWNDPNPPYFGGLQMGYWFMQTYGGSLYATKGTADYWTAAEQMAVAGRAYHASGHSSAWLNGQWPGTSSECGA